MRFVAPSALPSRRVYFPEPDPEPACGHSRHCPPTCRPKATHLRSDTPSDHVAAHCPTADESVVVMGGSAVREVTVHGMDGHRAAARRATCVRPSRQAGHRRFAVQPRSVRDRSPERRALTKWRPSISHRVRFVPGPSGGGAWSLPGGNIPALLPSDPASRPDQGWSSVGRPPAPPLPVSGRSSMREASETGADRPRLPSEEENRGARPEWAWFLVASFQARFGPSTPFLTTLTVSPSPRPSGMFHPVTLVGFGVRQRYPPARFTTRPTRRPSETVCLPRSPPLRWKCGPPRRANVHFLPGEPGTRCVLFRGLTPPRWSGPLPSAFTPDQVSRARARRDRCSLPGSR